MSYGAEETDRLVQENEALRGQIAALKAGVERLEAHPCLDGRATIFPAANPNPVLHFAADGTLLYANASSTALLAQWGCPIGGKPPDDVRQAITEARETGAPLKIEARAGGLIYSLTIARVPGTDHVNLYAMDITERTRTEAVLQQSEARFRDTFERATVGQSMTGVDGRLLKVNQALADMLGFSIEELQQVTVSQITHPDDLAETQECIRSLFAGERNTYRTEKRYRHRDGHLVTADVSTTLLRDAQGAPVCLMTSVVDISEHKRVAHDLERSETRYRRLFEAARDGILILDADTGRIVDVNPFLTELTGYSRDEFLAKYLWEIGPLKDIAASKTEFAQLRDQKLVRYEDLPLKTRDGRKIDVEFVSNVYRVDGENVVQCNIRDISERKRAEAEQKSLEDQLRLSHRLEAIGSLAGGVAHDFNNLLSVILCCTEFAMAGVQEDDRVREELLQVKKAGDRAVDLTRQLLAFSRKQVLQPAVLNLNEIAAGVEKMLRRILGEDIDYRQVLAPDLGMTRADPGQIEQVLMNLVVNARDAMPDGGKLTVETSNQDLDEEYAARHVATTPGPYIRLAVTDTGCGMDADTRARIFEPFFTTKGQGKGTGLGLSTVYGIVKQSGGNIWVYSEPGHGTTFKIYLPRDFSAITTVTDSRLAAVPALSTGNETILVVEDEEAVREIARRILREAGYTVLTAASPDDALLTCQAYAGRIHLLLTDVVMPQMSGRVLAERLVLERPGIKVVYMSGYTDDAIVHRGALDPGTNFVPKPFSAADLTRKVLEVLDSGNPNYSDGHEPAIKADAKREEQSFDKDGLRALPLDVLNRLRHAVIAARHDEIIELLEAVRIADPKLATELRRMADVFDYEGLRGALASSESGSA
jgi:two-component system, cell cycle sensor histidine kinase and response regulator CckA